MGPTLSSNEQKEHYTKSYGFTKGKPVRSPVDAWEHGRFVRGDTYMASAKEVGLIKGERHGYRGARYSNSYGNRPARRNIGPASKR